MKTFPEWMEEVDAAIESECDLHSEDLPDAPYWDLWDQGWGPRFAAKYAIRRSLTF